MLTVYTINTTEQEIDFYLLRVGLDLGKPFPISHLINSSGQGNLSTDLPEITPTETILEML